MTYWHTGFNNPPIGCSNTDMGGPFGDGAFNGLQPTSTGDGGVRELWDRYHEAKVAGMRRDALLEV